MRNEGARQVAIEAKFIRPRHDRASLRPDVHRAFAAALTHRLTVVCAPAGYGKTTSTAAVLERFGCKTSWYKLDLLDHDPLAFLAGLVRALQRTCPGFGDALLLELESGPVRDLPAAVLAARFCSECDRLVTEDHHVILDDYHEAMDSAAMNDVLGYLLENCPATIHFVVLTRYEPAFRLEKLRLDGEVARVPRDLLLFDAGQAAEVLHARSGEDHDPAHIRRLLELTEGWPASVVLAGMALSWLDAASLGDALSDPRLRSDVFSYLAEQVLQRQDAEVQQFLLRTCCPEQVTVELAEQLTGASGASRHLHYLTRNHIFTFDTDTAGAYRYHNLLRDFLRQRVVQDQGEAAYHVLQLDTAIALEDCGDRPGAIELLLGSNEPGLALEVVARGGEAELERRPSEQLRLWVGQLSPALEAGRAWALVVAGVLGARESRFSGALADLRLAAETLEHEGDREGLYQVLSIMEWAEFWSGDSSASMATCARALEYADADAQRLHTLLSLLSAALDMRRWDTVASALSRAEELLPHARPEEAARAQALRAHAAFYRGDVRAAHDLIQHCNDPRHTASQRAATLNTRGMIETSLGDYDSAAEHLQEAAEAAAGFGHALASYMIEDNIAFLEGSAGRVRFRSASTAGPARIEMTLPSRPSSASPSLTRELCFGALEKPGPASTRQDSQYRRYLRIETRISRSTRRPISRSPKAFLERTAEHSASVCQRRPGLRDFSSSSSRALLYAGLLAEAASERPEWPSRCSNAASRVSSTLGHINLVAQELCPRPELASLVLRRHRSNGLGPSLLEALSRHPRFGEAAPILRGSCPSQVGTWIDHLDAGRSPNVPGAADTAAAARPATRGSGERPGRRRLRARRTHRTRTAGP